MSASLTLPTPMTVDEFIVWEPGDDLRYNLVDGVPLAMSPASRTHGTLQAELTVQIETHLRSTDSPCNVVITPGIVPGVRARHNMRVPDLVVTCTPYDTEEHAVAGAVLVVEILSPSNQTQAWANVWTYLTIPGLREILILRSVSVGAALLRRGPDGTWPEEPDTITDGDLVLDSIALRTPLASLYRRTRLHGRG